MYYTSMCVDPSTGIKPQVFRISTSEYIESSNRPRGEAELMILSAVEKLIERAAEF
ncbi:MAG: hypothetical protein PHQ23_12800 [Candidatus Wallbacteria bacterium]|nr:hypothetical protein [Candidatus Wallbacteria bacterium]